MKKSEGLYESPLSTVGGQRASNVRWIIVALLMAFSFMNYFNRVSLSVAGDEIREAYNLTATQLGTVFSALILAYTIFMIPGGWFSDRAGGWIALGVMGLGTATFCGLTGLLPLLVPLSQPMMMLSLLWLVRGAMGAFTAPLYPAAGRVVSQWVPFRQRAGVNALVTGIAMVGIAVTYPLFGALMDSVGLSLALLISAAITATIAFVWLILARNEPKGHPKTNTAEIKLIEADIEPVTAQSNEGWTSLLTNKSLWLLTFSYATFGYVEYLVFFWSEFYFNNVLSFSDTGGRVAAMIPPLCMGICMPIGGVLSDRLVRVIGYRLGRATVAMGGMIGCASMISLATIVQEDMAIVACFSVGLGLIGIAEAAAWATAIELGGRSAATSAAIANTGGNLGGTISPTVTPFVSSLLIEQGMSEQQSWSWGMRLASAICLFGAMLWIGIDASERK